MELQELPWARGGNGRASTNLRMPVLGSGSTVALTMAPLPVASVMVTTGAMYPAPGLPSVMSVMTPPTTVAEAVAFPSPAP